MIDSNPRPSRQLQIFACLARWSLGLLLAFWLLLSAVAWVLHGFIVPRISEWRPHIERLATKAAGIPVRIEHISARSEGLLPTIHLQGLTLANSTEHQGIRLENVTASISARSLLRLGIEQLYIDAPDLEIRRLEQGLWQIGGMTLPASSAGNNHHAWEWLLQQPELIVRSGRVIFNDDAPGGTTIGLHSVDITIKHSPWRHSFRLDARSTKPSSGQLQLQGIFHAPLLPSRQPVWQRWSGQWYAATTMQQLPALPWPADWQIAALSAKGQARAWLDIDHGKPQELTADIALEELHAQWRFTEKPPLAATAIQARVQAQWQASQAAIQVHNFQFTTDAGAVWPSSNWQLHRTATSSTVKLEWADLAAAQHVAQALPLPEHWLQKLKQLQPHGTLHDFQASWNGQSHYRAHGVVKNLSLSAQPKDAGIGTPGFQGLNATFDLSQAGGSAQLALQQGALVFPGVFEEASIPIDSLQGSVHWQVQDQQLNIDVPQLQFSNADAHGQLSATWRTGEDPAHRLPGHLNLKGVLERADGARVFRYLPLSIPASARHYVRDSVVAGAGEQVEFAVQGQLQHMPFTDPSKGKFWIKAPLRGVTYNFVPAQIQPPGQAPWQTLTGLRGDLIFSGASMQVQAASSHVQSRPDLNFTQIEAHIPQLNHPVLSVKAHGQGALAQWLQVVQKSPLTDFTGHALDSAHAQGNAILNFALDLPIHQPQTSKVQGTLQFENNILQLSPDVPALQQLQGQLHFSEQGFTLDSVHAQALGGGVHVQGGMTSPHAGVYVRAQGRASALGLQADTSLPIAPWIAHHAHGQAAYEVIVTAKEGVRSIAVQSDLHDMQLQLPAPLDKPAGQPLPLEVLFTQSTDHQQTIQVRAGDRARVRYLLDTSGAEPSVVGGRIDIGAVPEADRPLHGVTATLRSHFVDADAWLDTWQRSPISHTSGGERTSAAVRQYLPQSIDIDIQALRAQHRHLGRVQAQVQQRHGHWQAQVQSPYLGGALRYAPPSAQYVSGHVHARLSQLLIPVSEEVQRTPSARSQPRDLPALDIQIDRLEVAQKPLGQLRLQAHNQFGPYGQQWVLDRVELRHTAALWQGHGTWGVQSPGGAPQTQIDASLTLNNAGQWLEELGIGNVIRQGQGSLDGKVVWTGSPITPDPDSMQGHLHLDVQKGQFLPAEPGMAKLLSVLSLQSLPRRFALDFRDVFSQGFAFDELQGDVHINAGIASTHNLQMRGVNAAVWLEGETHLSQQTQQLKVVVVPEINAMSASLAATAIHPVIGIGSFLAQWALRAPLMEAATRSFYIHGTWQAPVIDPIGKNTALPVSP